MPGVRSVVMLFLLAGLLLSGGLSGDGFFGPGVAAAATGDGEDTIPLVTADEFMEWLEGKDLAFLEMWDPGCPFCRMAEPVLSRLSEEMNLNLVKVDINEPENLWLVRELNLTQTPTIWAFVDGRAVQPPIVGYLGEEGYRETFEAITRFAEKRRAQASASAQ